MASAVDKTFLTPYKTPTNIIHIIAGGYAVIGAAKQVWEAEKMFEQVEEEERNGEVQFMVMQMLPLDRPIDFTFREYGEEGARSQNDIDWDEKEEMYVLCTVRKV